MRAGTASRRSRATRPLGRTSAPKAGDTRAPHVQRRGDSQGRRAVEPVGDATLHCACLASAHVVGDRVRSLRICYPPQQQADVGWWQPASLKERSCLFPEAALRTEEMHIPDLFQEISALSPYYALSDATGKLALPPFSKAVVEHGTSSVRARPQSARDAAPAQRQRR
jgi:hypothetical protein